jgi:hypothetical protein
VDFGRRRATSRGSGEGQEGVRRGSEAEIAPKLTEFETTEVSLITDDKKNH